VAARGRIARARTVGVSLSLLSALALAVIVARWTRAERARQDAAARAARGEALSRLAAMAAHEIRNPLGVIRGTIDLMRERSGGSLSERDRQALGDVTGEVERLRRLTQDLLDLASDRPLALERAELGELLVEEARAAESRFPGVTVRCHVGVLPPVDGDGARLRQVFANLLANAAQAQRQGEILVRADTRAGAVRVLVEDHGPGVPDGAGERLFELYFTTKSEGTGLGLAIARRIVERHGGTLAHVPGRGPGATFEVILPVAAAAGLAPAEG
jgi:signal transduction histidine kinase